MNNEKFILALIRHMKNYGYWYDCEIYGNDKCWSDFDISDFRESAVFIEKKEGIYINSIHNDLCENNNIVIKLTGRRGGVLYSDAENPFLYKLSPYVQRFMRKHREMYHIKNHAMADGAVALFALESFLKKYNRIIVDWNVDEDSDIIIISKKSEESLQKRKEGYEIFKRIIGYNY